MFVSAQKVFTIFVEKRCKVDEDREMKKCFYVRVNSKYFILNYLYIYTYIYKSVHIRIFCTWRV